MNAADTPHTKIGVGVMVMKEGKVLMALRKASHGAGGYQFLGGHLEYMESFEECARREVREEAGIEIQNIEFVFCANVKKYAPKHYVHIGLLADWKSGEPKQLEPEKAGPWQWYALDEIPQPLLSFAQMQFEALQKRRSYFDNV